MKSRKCWSCWNIDSTILYIRLTYKRVLTLYIMESAMMKHAQGWLFIHHIIQAAYNMVFLALPSVIQWRITSYLWYFSQICLVFGSLHGRRQYCHKHYQRMKHHLFAFETLLLTQFFSLLKVRWHPNLCS